MKSKETILQPILHTPSKPGLPPNFAMTIIEKEIELDKALSKSLVSDLVELYSQAIEFYNFNNDPKCYDYQDRMHKMLLNPQIMSLLSSKKPPSGRAKAEPVKSSAIGHKQELEKSRKLMAAELKSTLSVSTHKAERNITRAIDEHENTVKEAAVQLAVNFKMQDDDLMSRLENRRKLNRTFTSESPINEAPANSSFINTTMEIIESDKSGGYSVNKHELNQKIEELMSTHFAEKAAKIAEINVKYEKEILEMQDDGVMALVIAQLRQNMKEELETVGKEFDSKRRAAISKLKQEFH